MDVNALKGRIGEAFVVNILRQAGYKVSRLQQLRGDNSLRKPAARVPDVASVAHWESRGSSS